MGFLNGFPMLYERAILWSTAAPQAPGPVTVRPITPTAVGAARTDTLIDFTIDDTKPVVAHATATVYVLNTGRVARGLGESEEVRRGQRVEVLFYK